MPAAEAQTRVTGEEPEAPDGEKSTADECSFSSNEVMSWQGIEVLSADCVVEREKSYF